MRRLVCVLALTACASLEAFKGAHAAQRIVSRASAPPGMETTDVQWVTITAADLGVMRAAIARPRRGAPFATLIILHGSHGFAREYVELAREFARNGILAIAPCWFSGGSGAGARFIAPIACSEAPRMAAADSPEAMRTITALVMAARTLRGVRRTGVALFGHSRGGGAALNYLLRGGDVSAVVLNSAGYPQELTSRAGDIHMPLLILHGMADAPRDGGSALTNVQMARNFEAAARRAGKTVESEYYGGGHNSIFTDSAQHAEEVRRTTSFLRKYLAR